MFVFASPPRVSIATKAHRKVTGTIIAHIGLLFKDVSKSSAQ